MSRSLHLRLSDVRLAHRIVHECRELWADPAAWRQHLVDGASRLTGMTVAHSAEVLLPSLASTPQFRSQVAAGFSGTEEWKVYRETLETFPNLFDFFIGSRRLLRELAPGRLAAALREELCVDRRWYRSQAYNDFRRKVHSDGNVVSVARHSPSVYSLLDVNQHEDDRRPTVRTKRQLILLHRLIAPLVGAHLATENQLGLSGLSPQLRAVLQRMLEGQAESAIGAGLGIRPATVHEYIGKIYRHFRVNSRAELMAYFIRRRPTPK